MNEDNGFHMKKEIRFKDGQAFTSYGACVCGSSMSVLQEDVSVGYYLVFRDAKGQIDIHTNIKQLCMLHDFIEELDEWKELKK